MNSMETIKNCRAMGFNTIHQGLEELLRTADESQLSYLQFVDLMLEQELQRRRQKRISYNLSRAGFPLIKRLDEFDFSFQTTVSKNSSRRGSTLALSTTGKTSSLSGPPEWGRHTWRPAWPYALWKPATRYSLHRPTIWSSRCTWRKSEGSSNKELTPSRSTTCS